MGLCATEGCTGKPVHVLVYKYCEKCAAAIARDLECGLGISLASLHRRTDTPQPPPMQPVDPLTPGCLPRPAAPALPSSRENQP